MRTILHVDMNSCYASIEAAENPALQGKPLAVCGSREDRHGIVLAKSQEAKCKGVKTGETIGQAQRKCPELILVPPRYELYLVYSQRARALYYEYTNQVEPFGLDECWLDVTGSRTLKGDGPTIAHEIRERMKRELGVTVSIGVSYNKVFAKLGSDMKKPDAVTVIPQNRFRELVWPLPVRALNGIGGATERKLLTMNIRTLGDLAHADPRMLKASFGVNGTKLWNYANGRDERLVADAAWHDPIKSISRGVTCREDLQSIGEVQHVIQQLALEVGSKLKKHQLEARGLEIIIRQQNLHYLTFRHQMAYATSSSMILTEQAMQMYRESYNHRHPVRAVTMRVTNLMEAGKGTQLDFFHKHESFLKKEALDDALYQIQNRYGKNAATFGPLLGDIKLPRNRSDVKTLPGSK